MMRTSANGPGTCSKIAPSSQHALTYKPQSMVPKPNAIPFTTIQIISPEFTYVVPAGPGRKFVRLYFYPNQYGSSAMSDCVFDVTSECYTLFTTSVPRSPPRHATLIIPHRGTLYQCQWRNFEHDVYSERRVCRINAYAFINGIEDVSMTHMFEVGTNPVFVMPKQPYSIDQSTTLQNVYRLNVGEKYVSCTEDSELYGSWDDDSPYIWSCIWGLLCERFESHH